MAIVWLSLIHYYTTFSGFVAYLFIFIKRIKLSLVDAVILCSLILLFVFQLFNKDWSAVIIDYRFYWGWMVFYFIFKANVVSKKILVDALVLLSILTLVETVLINTVIAPYLLPNFPDAQGGVAEFRGDEYYQRPYSFGGSATVGSSLLVILMALCNVQGWRFWLAVSAVLFFVSGTGIVALFVLLLVRYRPLMIRAALPLGMILLLGSAVLPEITLSIINEFTRKIGSNYIGELIDLKYSAVVEVYKDLDAYALIFGAPDGFRGGDFGLLAFVVSNGILGLLLFLAMIFFRTNRTNIFPLFLIVATTLHYPVLFFLPGQMMFGLLLSLDRGELVADGKKNLERNHFPS
jgi:hypothetical protein